MLGLLGIGLGLFKIVRPRLGEWRGLFPSSGEHEQDLRMMEEALAGIYRGQNEKEFETFRSYFSSHDRDDSDLIGDANENAIPFGGTGDYEGFTSPEALQARYGARTVAVNHDDTAPKVVRLTGDNDGAETEAQEEEEEDLLSDVLAGDPLLDTASGDDGLDGDLRSLFEEVEEVHAVSEAVRRAIPEVTIEALIAEARDVYSLVGGSSNEAAA